MSVNNTVAIRDGRLKRGSIFEVGRKEGSIMALLSPKGLKGMQSEVILENGKFK
jgi:hypothetical protein